MLCDTPPNPALRPFAEALGFPYPATEGDGAERFASAAIRVICGAGTSAWAGRRTAQRCLDALRQGGTARMGLRHPGKAASIDRLWRERQALHHRVEAAGDPLAALDALPGIGPALKHRLAAELGLSEPNARRTDGSV